MASHDSYQAYLDACDDLEEVCTRVQGNRDPFDKTVEYFYGWATLWEDCYWKADDEVFRKMTQNLREFIELVEKLITLQQVT